MIRAPGTQKSAGCRPHPALFSPDHAAFAEPVQPVGVVLPPVDDVEQIPRPAPTAHGAVLVVLLKAAELYIRLGWASVLQQQ